MLYYFSREYNSIWKIVEPSHIKPYIKYIFCVYTNRYSIWKFNLQKLFPQFYTIDVVPMSSQMLWLKPVQHLREHQRLTVLWKTSVVEVPTPACACVRWAGDLWLCIAVQVMLCDPSRCPQQYVDQHSLVDITEVVDVIVK